MMIKSYQLIMLFFLFIILFYACDIAFYNPFSEDTYTDGTGDSKTSVPTGVSTPVPTPVSTGESTLKPTLEPTPEPTSEPTAEPTPAPGGINDTPETAEPIILVGGIATVASDSSAGSNAVILSGDSGCCVPFSTEANDLFYSIVLSAGDTITITVTPGSSWDPAIYLFSDTQDPEGSCVAGADEIGGEVSETITYTVPVGGDGTYIIGIDSFFDIVTNGGPFDMYIEVY